MIVSCIFSFPLATAVYCDIIQVDKLMGLVVERFPNIDQKKLILKMYQKCRERTRYLRLVP